MAPTGEHIEIGGSKAVSIRPGAGTGDSIYRTEDGRVWGPAFVRRDWRLSDDRASTMVSDSPAIPKQ